MSDVTLLLEAVERGESQAAEQLLPLVYDELRKLASARMAHEKPGQTLSATSLVHEAYLRLVDAPSRQQWHGCGHFFAAAAEAMRRILIEQARRKRQPRRGGDLQRIEWNEEDLALSAQSGDFLDLDDALTRLEEHDSLAAQLVKLRYFAGLSMPLAAQALEIPLRTAERNWTYAKAWLHRELSR